MLESQEALLVEISTVGDVVRRHLSCEPGVVTLSKFETARGPMVSPEPRHSATEVGARSIRMRGRDCS